MGKWLCIIWCGEWTDGDENRSDGRGGWGSANLGGPGQRLEQLLCWRRERMVFCTSVFIAVLFTIAKTWNQPKSPLTDEWIKKIWYIYTMEYYSAIEKNKIMLFAATWVQLEIVMLSEVRKRKTNTIWYHLYVESKIWHKWSYLWNGNTDIENRLVVAKGEGLGGGVGWEFGVGRCKLLHLEWINNKVLLYSTGNYIQSPGINHNGKEY